ncbi:hypothetical protein F2P81_022591 [Scophthalmus maximus]|uniref:Death domain-containing protein n=1 Tax=Scophthalmus maximus TaxID=52904 RepID=A0A6A4S230_SCOMX|nr:hypothetical protein F2P81_022591 [Scophthalmus maximus]
MGGSLASTDSPAGSPAASPLKSTWPFASPSPACPTTMKATLGTPPPPPAPTLSSPVKSQGQYPVQGSASLVSSGSPCKPATDPASIKNLASAYTSRTSPLHSILNGSVPERSSSPITAPASSKTPYNMYNANLPFKTALVVTDAGAPNLPSVKSISSLSSLKTSADSTLSSRGGRSSLSSLSSTGQTTIPSSEFSMMNGSVSPVKYPSSSSTPSSPSSRLLSERSCSLQERILATTQAATSGVSAAINEAIDSYSVSGYGTLRSLSSSRRSAAASSAYGSLRSVAASTSSVVTSNTVTVPVYSLVNMIPETPVKPGPGSLKMALPDPPRVSSFTSSSLSTCVTTSKINSQLKSPPFITPPIIHPTAASNQEILKDVADMKEDLMRMTAILQTDTQTAAKTVQTSRTGTPKEPKLEDEEPFTLVEKVKEDLVKVSKLLQKDIMGEGKAIACKERVSEDEWEEFSKDEIEEAQRSALTEYYSPFDENTLLKHQSMSSRDLELARVVDFLTNDVAANSLSKMAELKCRYEEEAKREGEGEEKQKRVLKPSMSIQEHKLKMPPPVSGMLRSPSEKDLSKLAESYQGSETILESPEDLSHEQDKSPLSDSGFETRSEKTPSAPQSAESTGPKPLFTDSPIPPCVTETRTEVVHIRSYDDPCEPLLMDEAASAPPPSIDPDAASTSSTKALQMKIPEDDSMMNKSMCLKEETHITTTTRMVYHKPQLTDGAEMIEEAMSVRDIMKAFQSGDRGIKELGDYDEAQQEEEELTAEVPLPSFLETSRVNTPVSQEEDNDSAMVSDKKRHLISEEIGSHSTESMSQQQGSPKREFVSKSSKDGSPKSEPGSPKHAVWMRFTEDKHDRSRDKLLYEDRVDQSVKEAEEKLCEVSQFFRDKTEKLNDELQSPEKKPVRREPKETRSLPSSACSSPEKTQQKAKAGEEGLGKSKLREPSVVKMFGSTTTTEKKCSSLPSSPQKTVLSYTSDNTIKQTKTSEKVSKESEKSKDEKIKNDVEKDKYAARDSKASFQRQISEVETEKATTKREDITSSVTQEIKESNTCQKVQTHIPTLSKSKVQIETTPAKAIEKVGRQAEREAKGAVYTVKQTSNSVLSPISPDDDTLEQVSFIDSSGRSPLTPETPSSEEVSYDLTTRTTDGFMGFMPGKPSPIMEVSEESDDQGNTVFSFKEALPDRKTDIHATQADLANANKQETEMNDNHQELTSSNASEISDPERKDDSQSNGEEGEDESIFQTIPSKKFTFNIPGEDEEKKKKEKEKASKSKKPDKNGNDKELNGGTSGSNGSNGKGEEYEYEQNGNDQSITDCSIATTAEFSHDTDATEIDSLDGYELQDEDDGLCEQADLRLFGLPDSRRDVWATDTFRSSDRCFPQTKLEVIEEEKTPEECQKDAFKKDTPSNCGLPDDFSKDGVKSQEQKPSDKEGFSDTYFSYKLEEEFNSPFKTVATKGLDFDPWPSKGGEEEVVDMGGTRGNNGDPKPFGLAVDEQSQATTPDTTPARTPTDDSTPTSEPNPFPFHEGKMFEMTRSGAIDMSKRDMVEERLQFFQIELAREMDFSVEEINFIRVENPNSLTAQSFMMLKKWVHRDADALTAVLTKINRLDIVTLLEGPIFDYGNISGTRCFADDNAVFPDQSDGYHNIDLELQTPSDLNYQPPTPLRSDDFFSEGDGSVDSPSKTTLTRPSDLSLTQTTSTSSSSPLTVAPGPGSCAPEPPIAGAEDTALSTRERVEEKTGLASYERPDNDRRSVEKSGKGTEEPKPGQEVALERQFATSDAVQGNGKQGGEEEEEEMTQERLQSLLDDIKLEGGSEDEEMTEERVNAILEQVRQAEKDVCSVPGWSGESSGAFAESSAQPGAEEGSPDSLEQPLAQAARQNGGQSDAAREGKEEEAKRKGSSQEESGTAGPSRAREEGADRSQHKGQGSVGAEESGSDEETTVTTRVYRRRVILKGEEAKNIPGESVTEEQFTDEEGNLVTRKVIRKVVRRVVNSEDRRESEGETVAKEAAAAGGGGGGVAKGGADAASSSAAAGAAGGKGKKRGKRSRQGHRAEKSGEEAQRGNSEKHRDTIGERGHSVSQ